ncbi:flagellar motor protein MotB, partial [uncultured Marinobacter sp.]|uniref:flagellar motor protein MotB n=1 Tax=uncultured Marinobacter sp. TaxID=187379 RepID=UPI0030DCFD1E
MRRRRLQAEANQNRERWLISYADFITLLFAFFVVMYAVSSVNEGKYKVLSETLTGVFNAPQRSIEPIAIGEQPVRAPAQPDQVIPAQI